MGKSRGDFCDGFMDVVGDNFDINIGGEKYYF